MWLLASRLQEMIKKILLTLLFSWLFCTYSWGAIAFDGTAKGSSASDNIYSYSHTIGSGSNRILIVGTSSEDNGTEAATIPTGVTYNGVSMIKVTNSDVTVGSGPYNGSALWYLLEASLPSTGSYTVEVTHSEAQDGPSSGSMSFTGAKQEAPEQATTGSAVSGSGKTTSITTQSANAMIVDVTSINNANTGTADESGQTERWDEQVATAAGMGSHRITTTAGSYNMTWTYSGGNTRITHSLISLAEVAAARRVMIVN